MTHVSPSVYMLWSILSVTLWCFLLSHLWSFDRFRCLKWSSGQGSGTFKRVMTYSYLTSVPLLAVYSVAMAWIKYEEGYFVHPKLGVIPKPHQLWKRYHHDWIFPLYVIFAIAWSLEIVSHLEELCFWLFLLSVGTTEKNWFRSVHFFTWVAGSTLYVVGMPMIPIFLRSDPLKVEAYTFLIGGIGSLIITVAFIPVLFKFPAFLKQVKAEGADPAVVIRLATFHDLNIIRVVFRFVFVAPLLALAIDGVKPDHHHVNEDGMYTDLLAMMGAIGLIVSSCITLLVFFPRSIERETGYALRQKATSGLTGSQDPLTTGNVNQVQSIPVSSFHRPPSPHNRSDVTLPLDPYASPSYVVPDPEYDDIPSKASPFGEPTTHAPTFPPTSYAPTFPPTQAPRTKKKKKTVWEMVDMHDYVEGGRRVEEGRRRNRPTLHPMVLNYTSPIDLMDAQDGAINAHAPYTPRRI